MSFGGSRSWRGAETEDDDHRLGGFKRHTSVKTESSDWSLSIARYEATNERPASTRLSWNAKLGICNEIPPDSDVPTGHLLSLSIRYMLRSSAAPQLASSVDVA